jgi:hypothetical protein
MVKELTGINVFRIDNPLECSIIERHIYLEEERRLKRRRVCNVSRLSF